MSTPVVFYNADLVEQAGADPDAFPNDWDVLIGLAGAIDALGQGVDGMYYELGVDDWTTQGLILNFGGAMMTADRKSTRLNSVTNAHLVCRLMLEQKKDVRLHYFERPHAQQRR